MMYRNDFVRREYGCSAVLFQDAMYFADQRFVFFLGSESRHWLTMMGLAVQGSVAR